MPRGGARVGAGRPKGGGKKGQPAKSASKTAAALAKDMPAPAADQSKPELTASTPLDYMLAVMANPAADPGRRDRMAVAAAPYLHSKVGEGGKKDRAQDAAKVAGGGKFKTSAPPKLVSSR